MNLDAVRTFAAEFAAILAPVVIRQETVGSVRRGKPMPGDLELLLIPRDGRPAPEFGKPATAQWATHLDRLLAEQVAAGLLIPRKNGPRQKTFVVVPLSGINDFMLELYIVTPATWAIQEVIRTGPQEFSQCCVTHRPAGLLPPNSTYIRGETRVEQDGKRVEFAEEVDFLDWLGVGWIEPKDRRPMWYYFARHDRVRGR